MVDGEDDTRVQPLRPAAPLDGPLEGSGAAPDPVRAVPRPRRPWLSGRSGGAPATTSSRTDATPTAAAKSGPADVAKSGPADAAKSGPAVVGGSGPADAIRSGSAAGATGVGTKDPAEPDPVADDSAGTRVAALRTDGPKVEDPKVEDPKTEDPTVAGPKVEDAKTGDAKATGSATGPGSPRSATGPNADAPTGDAKTDTTPGDAKTGVPVDDAKTVTVVAADPAKTSVDELSAVPAARTARRRRVQFAHALRVPPRQAAASAARATRAWARRPSGRLTLPGLFLLALVAATAAAGALLVPATIRAPRPVAADASGTPTVPPGAPSRLPTGPLPSGLGPTGPLPSGGLPSGGLPSGGLPSGGLPNGGLPSGPGVGGRPSDALAGWAQQVGAKVNIPAVAMQAYGYAELMLAQTNRSCALSWTTLAAIGQVESGHGSANGARLGQDGKALPKIIGLPLDGNGGRMRIIDTDRGVLDGDMTLDRAIGPMQFIPTTWQEIGADADNDGVKDPHDLDDAALAAGNYLCKGGRNLSIPGDWWNAILSYNDVRRYAQDVYDTANRYGRASRL
ncbi:lytic murein transglycosylase [Micromonospora sp. NPDC023888]|uniref:lytic transglycosylase domain-containing protein n=1 Tax=Micromonospora sp. NPDC023888 TaxID=3155607 RepID=UPI0033C67F3E